MPIVNRANELNERISIVEMRPAPGPEPGEEEETEIFSCWAKVRTMNIQDVKADTGTEYENTIEVVIRQQQDATITNQMKVRWQDQLYNIVEINPDYAEKAYMVLVIKNKDL
ncbi:hypothetical protein TEHD86_1799 [Tetragenococcus halophilus subsp. halophilus]|uniref:phage head closure protein n=1 Tax=Tetragenococcus halophilus TaxID=51669 RepID=UPI000CBDA22C|nr:phage head closure protein [Tetragenococcus halophilus]MCO7026838.1 phage head closure protein [Tetragenococcus halophilus]GBD79452.1 hypothetical protein TEHD10_0515 [Tetragenococcus halophilus subsp. halophilus]GBD83077.1 hypothetical protein TEHD86_1799 [Tetragenococcus halophilus subsp. halophilus]GFK22830.1 hypothetical protein WJ7_22930 [Tetragenococcus halophilus]GFK25213.1 hypothetical protein YA163_22760 [Tetragenococcus halophilus]